MSGLAVREPAIFTRTQIEVEQLVELTAAYILGEQETCRLARRPDPGIVHWLVEEGYLPASPAGTLYVMDLAGLAKTGGNIKALPLRMPTGESG